MDKRWVKIKLNIAPVEIRVRHVIVFALFGRKNFAQKNIEGIQVWMFSSRVLK